MASRTINVMNDSGWLSLSPSSDTINNGTIYYRKFDRFVEVQTSAMTLANDVTASSAQIIGMLPQGYRPVRNVLAQFGAGQHMLDAFVFTNGNMVFYKPTYLDKLSQGSQWYFHAIFMI